MARFQFRLDPLLRLRRRSEEDAKAALGRAIAEEARQRGILASQEVELEESISAQRSAREGEIWVQGQILALGWNELQKAEIARQMVRIHQAAEGVAQARGVLMEARRAVQILEKLRERRKTQWTLDQLRKEQVTLSDIAGIRWVRLQKEEEL